MTAFLIFLALLVCVLFLYFLYTSQAEAPRPLDPEAEAKAASELHRIRRRLDVAWTKSEQRRDGARLRRNIAEALDGDEP